MTVEVRRNPLLPIEAISPKSREVVFQFDRLSDAAAAGFGAAAIRPCLAGGIVSHNGYWWRMIGDDTPLPAVESDFDRLTAFVAAHLHESPGHLITFTDFYKRFQKWLPSGEWDQWSQVRVSRELPFKFQTGKGTANKVFLINAAWQPCEAGPAYVVTSRGKIRREDGRHGNSDYSTN